MYGVEAGCPVFWKGHCRSAVSGDGTREAGRCDFMVLERLERRLRAVGMKSGLDMGDLLP